MYINEQDKRRKRALIVFEIFAYGFLLSQFLIQLYMYMVRDW